MHCPQFTNVERGQCQIKSSLLHLMSASMLTIPIMDAFAKILTQTGIPGLHVASGRFFFQTIFTVTLVFLITRFSSKLSQSLDLSYRQNRTNFADILSGLFKVLNIARGWSLSIATTLFFTGLAVMPLPESTALLFVGPSILTVMSVIFLDEKFTKLKLIALVIGFICVLLITKPGVGRFGWASLYPLGAAFFFSLFFLLTRMGAAKGNPLVVQITSSIHGFVLLVAIIAAISLANPSFFIFETPTTIILWTLLPLIGLISAVTHIGMIIAFSFVKASVLAPLNYLEIVSATLLGFFLFDEILDTWSAIGVAIIILSGIWFAKNLFQSD